MWLLTATAEIEDRNARKVREGTVISNKMDKTAVVEVVDRVRHAKYNKFVLRTKKLHAHDESNDVNIGDKVRMMETRPLSKTKNWRLVRVVQLAFQRSPPLLALVSPPLRRRFRRRRLER